MAPTEESAGVSTPKEVITEETAPMEESTGTLASAELPSKEVAPTRKPTKELAVPMATDTKPAGAPSPLVQCERKDEGEGKQGQFPGWMKVFHPTWLVTPMGQTPPAPNELRHQLQS